MEAALDLLRLLYRGHEAVLISCHILTTKNEEKLSHLYSIPSNLILYNYILASKFAPTASIRTIWLRCMQWPPLEKNLRRIQVFS